MRRNAAVMTMLVSILVLTLSWAGDAAARAGGGRFSGSAGSRSYSSPVRPAAGAPAASRAAATAAREMFPEASGRASIGGLVTGGLLGGMLLGGSTSGMGLADLVALGLLASAAWKLLHVGAGTRAAHATVMVGVDPSGMATARWDAGAGEQAARGPALDEPDVERTATDIFVKVQEAWSQRDLGLASACLTPAMHASLRKELDRLAAAGRENRIEGVDVESARLVAHWRDAGQDWVTVRVGARLVAYTIDAATDAVVEGSRSKPIALEEVWTLCRPVWAKAWRVSAIQQPAPAAR